MLLSECSMLRAEHYWHVCMLTAGHHNDIGVSTVSSERVASAIPLARAAAAFVWIAAVGRTLASFIVYVALYDRCHDVPISTFCRKEPDHSCGC